MHTEEKWLGTVKPICISAENYLISLIIIILVYQKSGKERTSDCHVMFSYFKIIATVYISDLNKNKSIFRRILLC